MTTPNVSAPLGLQCKSYLDTASPASWSAPTWTELKTVRDMNLPLAFDECKADSRASALKKVVAGMVDVPIEGETVYDMLNAAFAALFTAMTSQIGTGARTPLHIAFADGGITTSGTTYIHMWMTIVKWNEKQPLEGSVMTVEFGLKPTYNGADATHDYAWVTVT